MSLRFLTPLYVETGLKAWIASPYNTKVLCLQRYVRFFAYGGSALILALYLSSLNVSDQKIGLFMTLTLLGDVLISLVLTAVADGIGRRRMLAVGALLMTASGVTFALSSEYWILVLASVLGVISPSGNEIGPFKAIEESTISHLTPSAERSNVLAWYIIAGLGGAASGTITFGWVVQQLQVKYSWSPLESYRIVFWAYAAFGLVKFVLALMLGSECELAPETSTRPDTHSEISVSETSALLPQGEDSTPKVAVQGQPVKSWSPKTLLPGLSKETRGVILKLCFLFGLDSLASGLAPVSWMSYFLHHKFDLSEGRLGSLFFACNILSSSSNLFAPSLARRLGLVKTMVFTHVPASLALAAIPLPNDAGLAMMFVLFRASVNSMDQAPRQAFLAAAVQPSERTAVMGLVNVVKTLCQSAGPVVTGIFANRHMFGLAFIVAGALKIVYDILMLAMFLGYRTVEERAEENIEAEIETEREEGTDDFQSAA
ncbi:uncharacterized protein Z518_01293 [Rhinocladiella mackenziei CBS 650.93]|uniref:Rhinocladiella mackenziei CBS 650.93 unplaced genomic scaffold supercont1.1, whole genome shotgun sequence n=1 Tax=Rhinocladiella mackenziei CBS 650.93 TaxID=1442369 RepID=A0A0D2G5N8_9EURO|nr:uncharacterized protein Z518_01293 [Rhinocladiella mackenziei CBS 650.93]KIX10212.1 hypothetical protein Z518_01293 [Rhinocladiella mackenziei CBS 650.93]